MVYESDFYTSRRPYRPSTYSVTPLTTVYYLPSIPHYLPLTYSTPLSQAELIYRPKSHTVTRLTTSSEPPHHVVRVRVRPSVILRELDRITHRKRPALSVSAVDDFYRSEATKAFEDETRRIRAGAAALVQRARSVVPRAASLAPIETVFNYTYGEPLPYRLAADGYLAKVLVPLRSVANHIRNISFYNEPAKKFTGRGHLACVHYSGSKAFPNRRPLYKELSVRDDVNLLSFYAKNRLAAAGLAVEKAAVKLLPWRPSRKFQAPKMMEDPNEELKATKAEREARFRASTAEPVLIPTIDLAEVKRKKREEARAAEELAMKEEAEQEAERKAQAELEAFEKKKQEEKLRKAREAKQQAEEEAKRAEQEAKAEEAKSAKEAEEARLAEKSRKEEQKKIEEARKAEEERLIEEARRAEEERLAEEARKAEEERLAEAARLAEEAKLEDERLAEQRRQEELVRLEELEKQAQEEREEELARQAAELAEIARQESELAAARLEELSRSVSAADNVIDAESSEHQEEQSEPIVEEPESPEILGHKYEEAALEEENNNDFKLAENNEEQEEPEPAYGGVDTELEANNENDIAEASEDEKAEPDLTDEE